MTLQEAYEYAVRLLMNYNNAPAPAKIPALHQAIDIFEQICEMVPSDAVPEFWAKTQNSLAIAYYNLPTRDRAANLLKAIACFEAALRVRTERNYPQDWAGTQNNLAAAYSKLLVGDPASNLQKAIACYPMCQYNVRQSTPSSFFTL